MHAVKSLFKKELAGYFANPTGYVFITLFVFMSGVAAFWLPGFFDRNLANLDQLNAWFGVLLLLIVPAITMASWANERQEGTDELLLTLPASELQLVLGKYLGCVAIYAICLLFAAGHVLVLTFLGRPDAGLTFATYLGYFLAGAALCGVGLAASSLSGSATVSFIASVVVCGLFVLIDLVAQLLPGTLWADLANAISLPQRLASMNRGVIDLGDVAFFAVLAGLGVALCVLVVVARRGGTPRLTRAFHWPVRGAALAVALICAVALLDRAALRVDATAERLWSLSPVTRQLIKDLPADRTLALTAYVSPKVPEAYVQQRETLLGLLREIEAVAGGRVQTQVIPTEANTEAAREAERAFGILPRPMAGDNPGAVSQVFLGVAISGGASTRPSVIEFLGRGLSPEYELARALRAAGAASRKKIGILETPAGIFGQFDFQTMQSGRDWPIVAELRKQYEVTRVAARAEVPADVDVLLVAQPSSLSSEELARVVEYIKSGRAALIFEDPMPLVNPNLATAEPRRPPNPMAGGQPPEPKADITPLFEALGAKISGDAIVWDTTNPHPQLGETPNEFIWAARGSWKGGLPPFNDESPITSGLQECVLLFPGKIDRLDPKPATGDAGATPAPSGTEFTTLLRSSPSSGQVAYQGLLQRGPFGIGGLNPNRRPVRLAQQQPMAVQLRGGPGKINAVLVSDLDMISPTFFDIRESGTAGMEFDNVTFVLNAVDVLAGDQSLLDLRKKRRAFRTLERLEERRKSELEQTQVAIDRADAEAQQRLGEARARMDQRLKEIDQRTDLDQTSKDILSRSTQQAEQRRLDAQSRAIEDQKRQTIEDARLQTKREIDKLQMSIRVAAVTLPPVPALLIGLAVMVRRRRAERAARSAPRDP
jgi:ABC-2 type transport system permease protein